VPDSALKPGEKSATEGYATITQTLASQLEKTGYEPSDINYLAFSHYHYDHIANANQFASATWIVRKIERDAMFAPKPPDRVNPANYSLLKDSKTIIIPSEQKRVPTFETDQQQTAATRESIEAFLKQSGAQLWIQHDYTANGKLKKAPQFYE
jgi:metal-dependent hydrolase (beta-lactamase superfamily II)